MAELRCWPLFISADSILDTLHRSYGKMLKRCERDVLYDGLTGSLGDLRAKLATLERSQERADRPTCMCTHTCS